MRPSVHERDRLVPGGIDSPRSMLEPPLHAGTVATRKEGEMLCRSDRRPRDPGSPASSRDQRTTEYRRD